MQKEKKSKIKDVGSKNKKPRPPIVVVLGHVDHGKTTLLDKIRKTKFASREAGGITQGIGASQVSTKDGKKITFIDTPGHAAFSNMRSQGSKVADIALLVVAADDGVKPQTREALEYILAEDIPYIVVATKTDLKTASVEKVKSQLEKEQVLFEGSGGDVPVVKTSGITGEGVDALLEMIVLIAELNDVEGDERENLEAYVIETGKNKSGSIVSVVVKNGKLAVREEIITQSQKAKVRSLISHDLSRVMEVKPGDAVRILGFSELPKVGERIWKANEKSAFIEESRPKTIQKKGHDEEKLPVVIKASNAGSLEALVANLPEKVAVIEASVGDVAEADIFVAKSANADVYVFESKASKNIVNLASTEGVNVFCFDIIYELFERLQEKISEGEVVVVGEALILKKFPYNKKQVAGCKVEKGRISLDAKVILKREDKELGDVKIVSMRKGKDEVKEAKQGEELGILFTPQLEFEPQDVLLSVRK